MTLETSFLQEHGASAPDIARETRAEAAGHLDWVGMENLATPILIKSKTGQPPLLTPGKIDVGVSLADHEARGIHMSRLFTIVQKRLMETPLSLATLRVLLQELIESQGELSHAGQIRVQYTLLEEREALMSGEKGWREYPVWLEVCRDKSGQWQFRQGFEVLYSSTCPCSAALANQLREAAFQMEFGNRATVSPKEVAMWIQEAGLIATPHAQRSRAVVVVELKEDQATPTLSELILQIEQALGTPVQAAVKRVDEQEFARLNAENLMFCEDAARRILVQLDTDDRIRDFTITVEHQESLHPHNAVARVRKTRP
jgi:GTP cyclohydrolase IB